jgi:DNA-directed RNA polymerase specialized sigma24 family protein
MEPLNAGAANFLTTHWTVVLDAKGSGDQAQSALENLCQTYWYPLYAFIRRQGYLPHDAQDLAQGFFERLLSKDYLRQVNREKGKFRSFLLASASHFISDERDRANALKRGGGKKLISLDEELAEQRYRLEPVNEIAPDRLFDRRWAYTLLETARANLRSEFLRAGKNELYDQLQAMESGGPDAPSVADAALKLGMSESAIKSAAFRFRQRYRDLIRDEVAKTVATSREIDDEIRHLISIVAS